MPSRHARRSLARSRSRAICERPPCDHREMRLTRRHLHARSVKGCAAIMAPDALAFSPVTGALCWGSPALSALWHVGGDASSPPVARLARALFHRHDPQEPLRLTANKSLPRKQRLVAARLLPAGGAAPTDLRCSTVILRGVNERNPALGVGAQLLTYLLGAHGRCPRHRELQ